MSIDSLAQPHLERLQQALRQQDPTATVDFSDGRLRVDSVLADDTVLAIARAELGEVQALDSEGRSECCGGCCGGG